mmetsp:Transcript_49902/g.93536  ORF Transcript_49902/g.93536 Transcript_49902/m.93536 type:complete len:392 (-) Transcript_49902:61-1236(-)
MRKPAVTPGSSSSSGYPIRQSNIPTLEIPPVTLPTKKDKATDGPTVAQVIKIVEGELQNVRRQTWAALKDKDYAKAAIHKAEEDGLKDRLEELTAERKQKKALENLYKEAQEQALVLYLTKEERLKKLNEKLIEARFETSNPNTAEICAIRSDILKLEEDIRQEKFEEDLKTRGIEDVSKTLALKNEAEKEKIPELPSETEQRRRDLLEAQGHVLPPWKPEERTAIGTKPHALGMLNKQARLKQEAERKEVVRETRAAKAKVARRRARNAQQAAAASEAHLAYLQRKRQAEAKLPALQEELKLLVHGLLDFENEPAENEEKRELEERRQEVEAKIQECEEAMRPPPRPKFAAAKAREERPSQAPSQAPTEAGAHSQEAASEEGWDDAWLPA